MKPCAYCGRDYCSAVTGRGHPDTTDGVRRVSLPKRGGGVRHIVVCAPWRAKLLRAEVPRLTAMTLLRDVAGVMHGFVPGRSPVSNARAHVGFPWTISIDLRHCFDNLHRWRYVAFDNKLPDYAWVDGVAAQGLPTSPAICNLLLWQADCVIVGQLRDGEAYTRYADDLTISCQSLDRCWEMLGCVRHAVEAIGHEIAAHKTAIQSAARGRRIVTGIAVGDDGIFPTRATKRRLRAAQHQLRGHAARGLAEWCQLSEPNAWRWLCRAEPSKYRDFVWRFLSST